MAAFQYLNGKTIVVSNVSEINSALVSVQPGDTLLMKSGTWTNAKIVFTANGTAANPVYLIAEYPGKVILNGTSTLRINGNYLVVKGLYFLNGYSSSGDVIEFRNGSSHLSNYCRLTDCAIVDYNPSDMNTDYKWVSLYGSHNRVDHCYFKGKSHLGTTLVVWLSAQPNYYQIDSNYFAYRPYLNGINGAETIRVGTSDWSMYDSYTTVEYNYFEECNGETEIISNKSCENIYRYNTFYECQGTLTLRHGNRCSVYGNYFFGGNVSNTGGIRIIGESHKIYNNYLTGLTGSGFRTAISIVDGIPNSPLNGYFQVKNAVVAFNTIVNNKYSIEIGSGKSSTQNMPPLNCVIADNIVQSNHSPIINYVDQPDSMTYEGNIMYGASLGITNPVGIKLIDPMLHLADDSLWRPGSGSPAIDSASGYFPFVINDFDGQPRDSIKDIGCDQHSSAPVIIHPLKPADAGIDWDLTVTGIKVGGTKNQSINNFSLMQNYPNPFNPTTAISYQLSAFSQVTLKVYNALGREIETLVNEEKHAGIYRAEFDGSKYPSGIYYYRIAIHSDKIETGNNSSVKKMILLK